MFEYQYGNGSKTSVNPNRIDSLQAYTFDAHSFTILLLSVRHAW